MNAYPPGPNSAGTILSVLVPAYNEEATVACAYDELVRVLDTIPDLTFEIIFTDNHSTDATFALLKAIGARDPRVKVIRFSRNIGYQRSLLVAYQAASGDCAVQVDCDLQDPPDLIPEMLAKWREGHEVVYGIRRSLQDGPVVALMRRSFYAVIRALSEDDLPLNAGEFRLVDKRILQELRQVEDSAPYLRGLISAMGFSQVGLEYDRRAREAGESKFPFRAMLSLAVDGIVNHSLIPLRIASLVSLFIGTATFLLIGGYLIGKLILGQDWPAGFATTTVLLLLSIMLNAMFLGIIGEYLGRIFIQTKRMRRPIIESEVNRAVETEILAPPRRTAKPRASGRS